MLVQSIRISRNAIHWRLHKANPVNRDQANVLRIDSSCLPSLRTELLRIVVLTVTVLTGKRSASDFFDGLHLQILHMVKNRHLAKSTHDAAWEDFKQWV